MNLEIHYKEDVIDRGFIDWIVSILKDRIKHSIEELKLIKWNEYLNKDGVLKFTSRTSITAKELIESGADNLTVQDIPNKFIIHINHNQSVNGLQNIKLETLCKLINFGNAEIKGYPIFTDTFKDISDNIDDYVEIYYKTIQ